MACLATAVQLWAGWWCELDVESWSPGSDPRGTQFSVKMPSCQTRLQVHSELVEAPSRVPPLVCAEPVAAASLVM